MHASPGFTAVKHFVPQRRGQRCSALPCNSSSSACKRSKKCIFAYHFNSLRVINKTQKFVRPFQERSQTLDVTANMLVHNCTRRADNHTHTGSTWPRCHRVLLFQVMWQLFFVLLTINVNYNMNDYVLR